MFQCYGSPVEEVVPCEQATTDLPGPGILCIFITTPNAVFFKRTMLPWRGNQTSCTWSDHVCSLPELPGMAKEQPCSSSLALPVLSPVNVYAHSCGSVSRASFPNYREAEKIDWINRFQIHSLLPSSSMYYKGRRADAFETRSPLHGWLTILTKARDTYIIY